MREEERGGGGEEEGRACEFCGESKALVYCRADSASLCLGCDRLVHAANSVSSKHARSLLCDSCRSAPSAILCSSHRLILCSNCDFDAHGGGGGGGRHYDRRPIEPFSGCPTAAELVSVLGVGGDEKALVESGGGGDESGWFLDEDLIWETTAVFSLDDLIVPTTSCHGFQAMGIVPPLPKDRNLACGKQKEEILRQLRELIKSETHLSNDCEELEPVTEFQPLVSQQNLPQASMLQWNHNHCDEATDPVAFPHDQQLGSSSALITPFPDKIADFPSSAIPAGGGDGDPRQPVIGENLLPLPLKGGVDLVSPDRDSVISRYKEKRKTRRYDKLIRYESRKARAESRIRIKGRFAKVNQVPQP